MVNEMKSVFRYSAILFLLMNLIGCASSSGVVSKVDPVLTSKPFSLNFIFVKASSSLSGLEAQERVLKDSLFSGLKETGLFGCVSDNQADNKQDGGIKIKAEIEAIKKVSVNQREWVGILAGRARILVQVTISDLKSGNQIESFEVEGLSDKSAFAGTTDEAIQRVADQVVAQVVKLYTKAGE